MSGVTGQAFPRARARTVFKRCITGLSGGLVPCAQVVAVLITFSGQAIIIYAWGWWWGGRVLGVACNGALLCGMCFLQAVITLGGTPRTVAYSTP